MKINTNEWNDFEEKLNKLSNKKLNDLIKILNIKLISFGANYPTLINEDVEKNDKIFRILSSTSKEELKKALESIV